jgi:ATP-dependent exoDNAse (exonuclease V) beta subunit
MSTIFPNEIVRASAGTGKTFRLSNRFLELVVRGADCSSILATTFTRKAAGEILDRIIQRFAKAALDDQEATTLGEFVGLPDLTANRCRKILAQMMRQMHQLQISTLDSFFSRLARSFSLELGLFADWRVISSTDYEFMALRDEAIERILQMGKVTQLVHLLTKGETNRGISQLIRSSVNHLYAIFLESPIEAWQQIPQTKQLSDGEILDICDQLRGVAYPQKRMVDAIEKDINQFLAEEYDDFLGNGLAAKVLSGENTYYKKPIPAKAITCIQQLIDEVGKITLNSIAMQNEANYELLQVYHEAFTNLKAERDVVQYDDIAAQLGKFVTDQQTGSLSYRLDRTIHHLLLDEFQDTSPIQWSVLRPFAEMVTQPNDEMQTVDQSHSFFCVGDTKQAIYRWRGGEARIFDTVDEQLPNVAEAEPLTKSFRSSPIIIQAVNTLFQRMPNHPNLGRHESSVGQWCQQFLDHSTEKEQLPGYFTIEVADDKERLLDYTADRIAQLTQDVPDKTIGVLVQKNDTVGQLISLLANRDIPASEEGGNRLTDSAAVRVILSALRLADHPGHRVAWFHLLNSPLAKKLRLGKSAGKAGVYQAKKIEALAAEIRQRLISEGYGQVIEDWTHAMRKACSPRELSRLRQLIDLAYSAEIQTTLRPTDFVKYIENARFSDPSASQVRVMNVHQAKGLEFDIVVLPEMDRSLISQAPTWISLRPSPGEPISVVCRYVNQTLQAVMPPHLQAAFEEYESQAIADVLCWTYVAVTRARQAMHVIIAPNFKERQMPQSVSGLIRAAFAMEESINQPKTLFESGNPDWYLQPPAETVLAKEVPIAALDPSPETPAVSKKLRIDQAHDQSLFASQQQIKVEHQIHLRATEDSAHRIVRFKSPSQFDERNALTINDLFHSTSNQAALQRGTIWHRWLEQIRWVDEPDLAAKLDDAALSELIADLFPLQIDLRECLASFRRSLKQPHLRSLLSRNRYDDLPSIGLDLAEHSTGDVQLSVQNERKFAYRSGDTLVSGSIDRLVLIHDAEKILAADVIDFKTDLVTDPAVETALQIHYQPQLDGYRAAVAQIYRLPLERILGEMFFVGTV